jgi:hypothetical protein
VKGQGICSYFRAGLRWGEGDGMKKERKKIKGGNGCLKSRFFLFLSLFFSFLFLSGFSLDFRAGQLGLGMVL